jgi:hypothetical protein
MNPVPTRERIFGALRDRGARATSDRLSKDAHALSPIAHRATGRSAEGDQGIGKLATRRLRSRSPVRPVAVLLAIMVIAGVFVAPAGAEAASKTLFSQNFESLAVGEPWAEGTVHGRLKSVFDGYGTIGVGRDDSRVLSIAPQASTHPEETHAALVASVQSFDNFELTARMKTQRQLRQSDPNPWEVGWVVWNYKDNTHFYYLILKPNGWELGKRDPAYPGGQRFLATGSNRSYPVGTWNSVRIRQVGNTVRVSANGEILTKFTDTERPYGAGSVGFYAEDAHVNFDDIAVGSI